MKRLNILIFVLAIIASTLTSCSNKEKVKEENKEATVVKEPQKEVVKVMSLTTQEIARTIEFSSTLEPFNEVHMAPSTPGRIEEINVEIGDRVSTGQILVKMNDAQLIQAQIQLGNLKTNFLRLDTLKKAGSIAQQQYDLLESQYEVAMKNVEFLTENTILKAPFKGVISGKYFEPGEMYSGSPVATVGKAAILSLIQIDQLKAIVSISEKYFPNIKLGMETSIKADVYPDLDFKGKVFRIHPTINPQTRSFDVEISIANDKNQLRPGMFCRVTFDLQKTQAIVLPALAVLKMQGSNIRYLFTEENGKAKRIEVTMGKRFDDNVEVISDELKIGDKVIIIGQARLLDGMDVKVVN